MSWNLRSFYWTNVSCRPPLPRRPAATIPHSLLPSRRRRSDLDRNESDVYATLPTSCDRCHQVGQWAWRTLHRKSKRCECLQCRWRRSTSKLKPKQNNTAITKNSVNLTGTFHFRPSNVVAMHRTWRPEILPIFAHCKQFWPETLHSLYIIPNFINTNMFKDFDVGQTGMT